MSVKQPTTDNSLSLSLVTTQKLNVRDAQQLKNVFEPISSVMKHCQRIFYKGGVVLGPFITFCNIIKTF